MAGQVSGIYSVETAFSGRGYRGRQYIPFPASVFSTAGPPSYMSAAYRTLLSALALGTSGGTFIDVGASTYNLIWCLYHSSPEAVAGTYTPITTYKVGQNWATQRRRGDFGKLNNVPTP